MWEISYSVDGMARFASLLEVATGKRVKDVMQTVIDERRESHKARAGEMASQNDNLDVMLHANH